MNTALSTTLDAEIDHLADYVDGVRELGRKFGVVAENQRDTASSLGRAVAALRSMAALSCRPHHPDYRNTHPANENAALASTWDR